MPVVNYTNRYSNLLKQFVASLVDLEDESAILYKRTFEGILGQPGLNPTDNCLILKQGEQIQGFALIFQEFPIKRSIIEVMTLPAIAGDPKEMELVERAVQQAQSSGLAVAHVCLPQGSGMNEVLVRAGFTLVRTYLDMLCISRDIPDVDLPPGYYIRVFEPGDTALLTRVQNDSFAGSWGFCPNTEEQIEYRMNMPNTSMEGVLFLFEEDKLAGYCWTTKVPSENGIRGMIGMIGVVPDYRGKGISRHILMAGMKYLRSAGMSEICLEVDQDNHPAFRLYTSTGFKTIGERHWFERIFPGT